MVPAAPSRHFASGVGQFSHVLLLGQVLLGAFAQESLPSTQDVARDPSEATAYEMGLQYSFHPNYLLDISAYYRDIDNYSSYGYSINPVTGGSYTLITSGGYADSRGLELGLERRATSQLNWRLNYALSYIKAAALAGDAKT
ncbi:MAG TPA: TonB-dependent receptor [Candidatus Handelsmanbacteria bacterium]|nr:TonB-dependent receptor [Candidatus Handelsmanbacteria bacterium]